MSLPSSYFTKELGKVNRDLTKLTSMRKKLQAIVKSDAAIGKQLDTLATNTKAALTVGCGSALPASLRSQNSDAARSNAALLMTVEAAIVQLKTMRLGLQADKSVAEAAERALKGF